MDTIRNLELFNQNSYQKDKYKFGFDTLCSMQIFAIKIDTFTKLNSIFQDFLRSALKKTSGIT